MQMLVPPVLCYARLAYLSVFPYCSLNSSSADVATSRWLKATELAAFAFVVCTPAKYTISAFRSIDQTKSEMR